MRNTLVYPITVEECAAAVEEAARAEAASGRIGGTQAYCLDLVAEFLRTDRTLSFYDFLDSKRD